MAADQFDVTVLGGGFGGYSAAIRAAQLGKRVALVEQGELGGTCLHVGCIPTKALLQASELFHQVAARGEEFGIRVSDPSFDYARVADRRDGIVKQLTRGVEGLMKKNKIEVVRAHAEVVDKGTVEVEGRRLQSQALIVATGSEPKALPGLPFDGKRIVSSDDSVVAREAPKSIAIIGAGAIGVEFATFYNQIGSQVVLLEALDRLVPTEDEDISKVVAQMFKRAGIDSRVGVKVTGADVHEKGVTVHVEGSDDLKVEQLLVAVGRQARNQGIGLDKAGVEIDRRGFVTVDGWQRTNVQGVWAIGDACGGYLLAHAAVHEGIIAAEDIAGLQLHPMEQTLVPRCTYSHPQIASVGLTEQEAVAAGHKVKVGRFPFQAIGRALIHGEPNGFAKLVADADSGQLLGTHIVGVQATELIAEPGLAQLFQGDAWEVGRNIHPHPTLSEVIGEAAMAVDGVAINI
ncbi:MAG: dihydrolipoyl dehydrogenase [Candidatus Dormibacteraeota bacterium]|nr:dihydrolipoyl dehydrogenase [Candidatus Dormibacteraeota bacterium]MBO0743903.1 dihydrolipoyl dehydrogenase [Candidatus Dormibacteraeota bacterium]